jgi:hypothetical protein
VGVWFGRCRPHRLSLRSSWFSRRDSCARAHPGTDHGVCVCGGHHHHTPMGLCVTDSRDIPTTPLSTDKSFASPSNRQPCGCGGAPSPQTVCPTLMRCLALHKLQSPKPLSLYDAGSSLALQSVLSLISLCLDCIHHHKPPSCLEPHTVPWGCPGPFASSIASPAFWLWGCSKSPNGLSHVDVLPCTSQTAVSQATLCALSLDAAGTAQPERVPFLVRTCSRSPTAPSTANNDAGSSLALQSVLSLISLCLDCIHHQQATFLP